MTKIAISTYQAAQLAAARRAGEKRTHIWASIREMFAIPRSLKLGMATDRTLYVKNTEPRQFLIADTRGRYANTATDAQIASANTVRAANAQPVTVATTPTPAQNQAAGSTVGGQSSPFRVLNPGTSTRQVLFISNSDLADALRNSGYGDTVDAPAGFPADIGDTSVVMAEDGVYVLADD